jgi:hypothetical protein
VRAAANGFDRAILSDRAREKNEWRLRRAAQRDGESFETAERGDAEIRQNQVVAVELEFAGKGEAGGDDLDLAIRPLPEDELVRELGIPRVVLEVKNLQRSSALRGRARDLLVTRRNNVLPLSGSRRRAVAAQTATRSHTRPTDRECRDRTRRPAVPSCRAARSAAGF